MIRFFFCGSKQDVKKVPPNRFSRKKFKGISQDLYQSQDIINKKRRLDEKSEKCNWSWPNIILINFILIMIDLKIETQTTYRPPCFKPHHRSPDGLN